MSKQKYLESELPDYYIPLGKLLKRIKDGKLAIHYMSTMNHIEKAVEHLIIADHHG